MKWTLREEREELKKDIERIKEKVEKLKKGNKRKMEDIEWRYRKREGSRRQAQRDGEEYGKERKRKKDKEHYNERSGD